MRPRGKMVMIAEGKLFNPCLIRVQFELKNECYLEFRFMKPESMSKDV